MELAKVDMRKSRKSAFMVQPKKPQASAEVSSPTGSRGTSKNSTWADHGRPTIMLRSGRISVRRGLASPMYHPPDAGGYSPVPSEDQAKPYGVVKSDVTVVPDPLSLPSDTEDTDSVQPRGPLAGSAFQRLVNWEPFQGFMATLIVGNAVIMGLETDLPSKKWDVLEVIFLLAFTAELLLRMLVMGHRVFFSIENKDFRWNIFDFLVVGLGLIDCMVNAMFHTNRNVSWMAVFRMVRLLRVLRILRIVRFLKQLYQLAFGISLAGGAIFWVSVLFSAIFYMCSIVLVRTLGSVEDEGEIHEFVRWKFGTIGRSMRTLFELMVAPDLEDYMRVIMQYPVIGSFLIAFIVYASFGMSAVVTGVITESMFEKNMVKVENQRTEKEQERKALIHECASIFDQFAPNERGEVSRDDLVSAVPQIQSVLESHRCDFPSYELERVIEIMDLDGSGTIDKREFTQSIVFLAEQVGPALLMELHFAGIQAIRETIRDSTQAMADVVQDFTARLEEKLEQKMVGETLGPIDRNLVELNRRIDAMLVSEKSTGEKVPKAEAKAEQEVPKAPNSFQIPESCQMSETSQSRVSEVLIDVKEELKSGHSQLRAEIEKLRESIMSQTLNLPLPQDFPKLPPPPRSTSKVREVSPLRGPQQASMQGKEQKWPQGQRNLLAEDAFREHNGATESLVAEKLQSMHGSAPGGGNGLLRSPFAPDAAAFGGSDMAQSATASAVAAATSAVAGIVSTPQAVSANVSPASSVHNTHRHEASEPSAVFRMGDIATMQELLAYSTVPSSARSAI